MKIYTNTDFKGFYPVGAAALVFADNEQHAAEVLNAELVRRGLPASAMPNDMAHMKRPKSGFAVHILNDGNY